MKKLTITRKGHGQNYLSKLLMIMKLTTSLLIFGLANIFATGFSQARFTIDEQNVSIISVFKTIENSSDYKFVYRNADVENVKVSVNLKNATVEEVLTNILSGTNSAYKVMDNSLIIILPSESIQPSVISGTVTDINGDPLPGVNVTIKGSTTGTVTDLDGNYSIEAEAGTVLLFSFIGYLTEEVEITSQTTLNVQLVPSVESLDEVVVIGYGTQQKVTVTGSVSTTSGEDIKKSPSANLSSSLAGRLPGVIIRQTRGELGYDDPLIRIRGVGTPGEADPLIIIDGIERSGLGRLDPNDIESITVLKDASAAIYGVRAANGVILVTTKRGRSGKPSFSFSYNHGIYQPTRIPEMMDAPTFARVANESAEFQGKSILPYTEEEIAIIAADTSDLYPNTDWVHEVLKPYSLQKRFNFSSSGGSENIQFFVSFGGIKQDPIFKNSIAGYTQYNVRSNIDFKVNKYLSLSLDVAGRMEDRSRDILGATTTWINTLNGIPVEYAYWPNGTIAPGRGFQSPLFLDKMGYYTQEDRPIETRANFDFKVPFIDGLGIDGSFYADFGNRYAKKWTIPWEFTTWNSGTDTYETDMVDVITSLEEYQRRSTVYTYNLKLKYNKSFNNHYFDAFILWEQSESKSNENTVRKSGYAVTTIDQLSAGGNDREVDWELMDGSAYENARRNYLGRFNYDYARKYMVQLQFRYDGSTKFPKENRYGFFPGVSVGWRISEESFMSNLSWLENLKIRASYGQLGNDRLSYNGVTIGGYPYLTSYRYRDITEQTGMSLFVYNTENGLVGNKLIVKDVEPNLLITWETAEKYNIGIDGSILNGNINFVLDLFHEQRNDILLPPQLSVPGTMGINVQKLPWQNIGKAKNKGFEFILTYKNDIENLKYNISGNIAYARNEIVSWDEAEDTPEWQRIEGHVIGSETWYLSDGIYNNTNEINASAHYNTNIEKLLGTIKIIDHNKDSVINHEDMVRINRSDVPELTYGFNFGAEYKGFDLSVLLQGQARAHFYQALGSNRQNYILGKGENNLAYRAEDRWWTDNTDGTMPRVLDDISPSEADFYLFTGNFLRIKNIELGYALPANLVKRITLSGIRLYVSAYNLYTFSKNKWIDPENDNRKSSTGRGGEIYNYPINRVYNLGVNITF